MRESLQKRAQELAFEIFKRVVNNEVLNDYFEEKALPVIVKCKNK
jgi:hypothetical protein